MIRREIFHGLYVFHSQFPKRLRSPTVFTRNPGPGSTNNPTSWPLVVCEVTYGDGVLLFDVGEEWTLVVDFEVEDSVLIWEADLSAVGG